MKRVLYKPLGFLFFGLACLGVLLPIIPGTPFLLLSAWFFARSSERWHRWLLDSEVFGPGLRNWEAHHCISLQTKVAAIVSMVFAGGASVLFAVDALALRLLGIGLILLGTFTVLRIPSCGEAATASRGGHPLPERELD